MSNPREKFGPRGILATKLVIAGSLLAVILYTFYQWIGWAGLNEAQKIMYWTTSEIGQLLFSDKWGIVIVFFGLVLFVAILGGVFIAQEEDE